MKNKKISILQILLVAIAVTTFQINNVSLQALNKKVVKHGIVASSTVLPLDPAVKVGKLPNGFTYYIRKNAEPQNRVTLYLANKVGSVLENDNQQGLAHFMEHMSFNGTKHFPKNELVSYLQKAGVQFGGDLNAYTSFDETVYQLPLPTDNPELLQNGFQIMRDWAQEATLDPVEINKERGIILEEKRLGKSASQRLQDQYFPLILNQSRYSHRLPIGKDEVLNNFKPEVLINFYKTWYRPDLQALIVVGDINVAATEKTIVKMFSDLKMPDNPQPRPVYSIPLTQKNQFFVGTDSEMGETVIQVMVKKPRVNLRTTADYRQIILRALFNQICGERFAELNKQANPPFLEAGTSIDAFMSNLDVCSTVMVGKPGELEPGFKAVWTEVVRLKRQGFTLSEFERAKVAVLQNMQSLYNERDKVSSENYTNEYLNLFLTGDAAPGVAYEYALYHKMLPGIKLADLNKVAQEYLTNVNRDVLVMGPTKDAAILPTEQLVNQWITDVEKSTIASLAENSSNKILFKKNPVPGKIISETKDDKLGLTKLVFANGLQVLLKPTNFKNDEIIFKAFSPGGTSLYNDSEYESAKRAATLVDYSGLSDFSSTELNKYLTGKNLNVSPYMGERSEGFSGQSSVKDFESALQLINLYFTEPRSDKNIYQGVIEKEKISLAARATNPMTVFSDSVTAILGNHHIRRSAPGLARLESINLDRAYEIYKERFADAGDFTFTFVGNINVEKLKPLFAKYLGSLPSIRRSEAAVDLGIQIPAGKIAKEINKGREPKSTVRLVFSGSYTYTFGENNLLDALSEVLTFRLMERLREDESGVYGVGVNASYHKYPHNRYALVVSFGCAPENVEKMIHSTLDEIKKLKEHGPELLDVKKVIAEELRSQELQLRDNGFWLNYLSSQLQNDESLATILTFKENISAITPSVLQLAAQKFLSGDNYARLILNPEK